MILINTRDFRHKKDINIRAKAKPYLSILKSSRGSNTHTTDLPHHFSFLSCSCCAKYCWKIYGGRWKTSTTRRSTMTERVGYAILLVANFNQAAEITYLALSTTSLWTSWRGCSMAQHLNWRACTGAPECKRNARAVLEFRAAWHVQMQFAVAMR